MEGTRGHDVGPFETELESRREKPWIAAVDGFAIGGACQWLLVVDRVVAEAGSHFVLPARKEGIIPGCANLRLPRIVGERAARQALFFNRSFAADDADGQLLADEVVPTSDMDDAIRRAAAELTSAGMTSAVGNRRALRVAQEPLDHFRRYMSNYARDQAYCLYSPALIDNLERNWNAKQRTLRRWPGLTAPRLASRSTPSPPPPASSALPAEYQPAVAPWAMHGVVSCVHR